MNKIKPSDVRAEARKTLSGKWGKAALITLCFLLLICVVVALQKVHPLLYLAAMLGVAMPLGVGLQYIVLDMKRGKHVEIGDLFAPLRNYLPILGVYLLTSIITCIGMVLLIVPGFILMYGLSMSFFILRDEPELGVIGSMKASWSRMKGHKMELFLLSLSFLGWILLGILTLMIGLLWLYPYMYTSVACFYERIKGEDCTENTVIA